MPNESVAKLAAAMRDVVDFPKPGIVFKDITPILADGELLRLSIDLLAAPLLANPPAKIVGIDARGFIFGAAVAAKLGVGFIPVRKKGKLPFATKSVAYALEYGEATVEMHTDAIAPGEKVALVDDLLATGGTAAAAIELIQGAGGVVQAAIFLIELDFLQGRGRLGDVAVESFLHY
jgi:adenine phosphoribosyltransferase